MRSPLRALARALGPPRPAITVMPGARVFAALDVQVLGAHVCGMDGTRLGPLAGARVTVVDEGGHQVYGTITPNPFPNRQRGTIRPSHLGIAVVAFSDGSMHQRRCYGRQVTGAQAEAAAFAAMAGT